MRVIHISNSQYSVQETLAGVFVGFWQGSSGVWFDLQRGAEPPESEPIVGALCPICSGQTLSMAEIPLTRLFKTDVQQQHP